MCTLSVHFRRFLPIEQRVGGSQNRDNTSKLENTKQGNEREKRRFFFKTLLSNSCFEKVKSRTLLVQAGGEGLTYRTHTGCY